MTRPHFLSASSGLGAAQSDAASLLVNGILGEAATFPLNLQNLEEIENIAWNSKSSIAFVVPGGSGEAPRVSVAHQNYVNRINVSRQNYNLQISHLRMEDAGTYRANINRNISGEGLSTTTKTYQLEVYRKSWGDRGPVLCFTLWVCYRRAPAFLTAGGPESFCACEYSYHCTLLLAKRTWLCFQPRNPSAV